MFDLSSISKAIAGGVAGLILAEGARYGLQTSQPTKDALSVVLTALVGYAVGHLVVYFAPKNK